MTQLSERAAELLALAEYQAQIGSVGNARHYLTRAGNEIPPASSRRIMEKAYWMGIPRTLRLAREAATTGLRDWYLDLAASFAHELGHEGPDIREDIVAIRAIM